MQPYTKEPMGLYVHVPFCRSKCLYCDFCSFPKPDPSLMEAYVDELIRRMEDPAALGHGRTVDTVYFGGGTPSLLPAPLVTRLTEAIHRCFQILPHAEITVECNPAGQVDWEAWVTGGVNRVSLGVQSMVDEELHRLGRRHRADDVRRTMEDVRRHGIHNISVDVMLGIPCQTADSLAYTLDSLLSLNPYHLSAYCLTIEDGTPFDRLKKEGRMTFPDEEETAARYEQVASTLAAHGWEHYEISNFAKDGHRSHHNSHTWQYREYLGLGVAAHSFLDGVRFGNSREIDAFLRGEDITDERSFPSRQEQISEYIMLGLRLADGIDERDFAKRFNVPLLDCLDAPISPFLKQGLLSYQNHHLALTEQGFLVSNSILSEILMWN